MTTHNISRARHRADVRPKTFLSDVSCTAVARRGSLGLAATGLAMGLVAPTASAFDPGASAQSATTTSTVSTSSSGSAGGSTYTVQAGDTVAEIAQSQGSSISGIIEANGLNAQALIFPGDQLTIPGSSSSTGAAAEPRAVESASRSGQRTEQVSAVQASTTSASTTSVSSNGILAVARQHVGTPYVWGGSAPGGFDCSGFTQYVFAQNGISLPRTTDAQRNAGTVISQSEARPGDLVWWPGHVGIYTGDGNHIAARNPGTALHESPIYMANPTFIRVS